MEALMSWLKQKKLVGDDGQPHADLVYAFESCGVFYAATADKRDHIQMFIDQMVTSMSGTLNVTPSSAEYKSVILTIGEVCTLLQESGHDKVFTEQAQRRAQVHETKRQQAMTEGKILLDGVRQDEWIFLADLLPF